MPRFFGMLESLLTTIIINLSTKTLTLPSGQVVPVAIGKETTPTPEGVYYVRRKVQNPIPYSHITNKKVNVPIYGNKAIEICLVDQPDFCIGIHGTNNQSSIGTRASAGCIRVPKEYEEDVFNGVSFFNEISIIN